MSGKLKIVQVIPELEAGGAERTTLDISSAVIAAGGQSLILSKGGRMASELASAEQLVKLPVNARNPFSLWRNVARIARASRSFGADIVHARSRAPAWSAYYAARKLGLPFITTYHGTYNESWPGKRVYNAIMAAGDLVIANSSFIARHIARVHKTDLARIRVIHRGLDPDYFAAKEVKNAQLAETRERINIPEDSSVPILLMPGRLTRWKGQELMLKAFAQVLEAGHKAVLVMPGDAQGRKAYVLQLEQLAASLGVSEHLRLPGHITDLRPLYQISKLVVSASLQPEAFGRIAIEAQASAKPVIASAHGGSLETVLDGQSGLLFKPGSTRELAARIIDIMQQTKKQDQQMGCFGVENVRNHFSVAQMCKKTLAVYDEVIRAHNS